MQEDGHMAWSSPIWVDYIPLSELPKIQNKRMIKPTLKKDLIEEDFDEEDEEDDYEDDYDE